MKKITLLFFMSLLSFCGYSQLDLEEFESNGTNLPVGWTHINVSGPGQWWKVAPHTVITPAYNGTGHAAYLQRENVTTGTAEDWLVTKQFPAPANGQLRFMSRLTQLGDDGSRYRIMIHTGNTPNDPASYTEMVPEMGELELNPDPYQVDYLEKVFSLPSSITTGQQIYIAFVMNGDNADRWLIDNVMVVGQCFDPTNLNVVGAVGLNSAVLTWTNTTGAGQWLIDIVPQASAPTQTGIPYTGAPPYTATTQTNGTPLQPNTDYKFYVKAVCGSGATSNWVGPFNFSTVALGEGCGAPINIANLPYSTTDDTANYGDTVDGVPGAATGCGSNNAYLNGNDVFYSFTPTVSGNISITVTNNGNYSGVFVYTGCANVGVSCVAGAVTTDPATTLSIPTLAVTAGQQYIVVISTWATPQTTPYTLTIQEVNCTPPVGLPVSEIGETSAQLSWTNPTNATSWQVVVQDPGDGIPQGPGVTVSTNTNYVATAEADSTPLAGATPYEYWVRANCGNGTFSAWAGPYAFNTSICETSAQCNWTFVMTDSWGDGWSGNTMTVSQNGIAIATLGAAMNSAGPISVTVPVCNNIPLELFWNAGGTFPGEVGISVVNSFGQTIFSKPSGVGVQNSSLLTTIVDCNTPACLPPGGLEVDNISDTSVDISWDGAATGDWNYYVVPAGSPAPTSSTPGVNTTSNPVTVSTGLAASTNYVFYVQMVCTNGNSAWAGPFPFTTAICPLAQQCSYDFVLTDSWGDGWNGNTMSVKQGGITVATFGANFSGAGPTTVTVAVCDGLPLELFWNSGGSFPAEVGVAIVNNFDQTIYTKPFNQGAPNSSLFTTTVDCDTPACVMMTGLNAYDFETDSAMLEWDGLATGDWEVYVVPAGSPAPTAATPGIPATTNPFEVALPTPATNYEFYVRANCDNGDVSDWAGPQVLHSAVCDEAAQCMYTFEMVDSWGDGWDNTMTIFQAGVPVATIGADFTTGAGPVIAQVPLCPGEEFEIFWNTGGSFPAEVGLTVYTPFMEDVYTKNFGVGTPGTVLFTGIADCTPPPCPKPQTLFVDAIELTTADLNWTEMGSATNWEVYVVPFGDPAPVAATSGTATTTNPHIATETIDGDDLTPGTTYQFYVRAICGGTDGNSSWSGPITFTTAVPNDDCSDAIAVGVNPETDCDVFATGTITGSTGSTQAQSCITWMDLEYDVWYSFEATTGTHAVSINNQQGATFNTVIYSGDDCGALTELACGDDYQTITGLTVGETYYVRVYTTFLDDPANPTSFEICVTSPPPPIRVSQDEYTLQQLVQEVLIGSECAQISNIQSSTGSDFGQENGIGYFHQNGSLFPMPEGVLLVTGDAMNAPGPNEFPLGWGNNNGGWDGDADLETAVGLPAEATNDATWISFDFVTLIDQLNFNFIFASEEYNAASFECDYSDSFAFILTDLTTGISTNLAVLPNTNIPIQVTNIHPDNSSCDAINEAYFGQYNNSNFDPINFNGQTIAMTATSPVIANHAYNIKLVIANETDHNYNSAVFFEAGSFDIGEIDLGPPLLEADGNAVCVGGEVVLDSGLNPDLFDFQWSNANGPIPGATEPSYTVTEEGEYTIEAIYGTSTCGVQATLLVEFYDPVEDIINDPANLVDCNATGYGVFDLSQNTATMLNGVTGDIDVHYYLTEADAILGDTANAITDLTEFENTVQGQQTIWVGIDITQSTTVVCHGVKSFTITVQDLTPQFTISDDFSICDGTTGTITVTPINYDNADVTYTWTRGTTSLTFNGPSITVDTAGDYTVTIDNDGCTATATVTVTVTPIPVADDPVDVVSCDSYVLPALSAGNNYYTGTNGTGVLMSAGESVTSTMNIYVQAASGTNPNCTSENVFSVTIVPTPVATTPGDVQACDSYVLPALSAGQAYYTAMGATGTQMSAGQTITTSQTLYVYAQSGTNPNCTNEASFVVTIVPSPVADAPGNVASCNSYTLPSLGEGSYYTGPGGTGTQLAIGTQITSSQTIYVFAQTGTAQNCTDENSFAVTIIPTPVIAITEGCDEGNQYMLEAIFTDDIYAPDNASFVWTDGSGNTLGTSEKLVVSGPGTYYVEVTPIGDADCPVSGQITVTDTSCEVQRGISPNGDEYNQNFDLTSLDVKKLSIFNRYGQEVYTRSNYTNQWEGQTNGGDELPTGTYFYMIERNSGESRTGWVYINREN